VGFCFRRCLHFGGVGRITIAAKLFKHLGLVEYAGFGVAVLLGDAEAVPAGYARLGVAVAHVPADIAEGREAKLRDSPLRVLGHRGTGRYNPGLLGGSITARSARIVVQEFGEM